jgi:hypothetical protein
MPAIKTSLADISADDIEKIIQDACPEDEELEFKQDIPTKGSEPSRWYSDQSGIDDYGRNKILAEVIALANTYGGDLVLGIVETEDKPARAAGLKLLPKPAELAHRLELAARDCIEPAIPMLQARGIVLDDHGSGIVIIRTPRSRQAPHRLRPTLHCYRRARDRTEQMSMREIQDLTFATSRGLEGVERRLSELRQGFSTNCQLDQMPDALSRLALNVRAVPAAADLYLDRVHNVAAVTPTMRPFRLTFNESVHHGIPTIGSCAGFHPVLRGTRSANSSTGFDNWCELYCDGSISFGYRFDNPTTSRETDHRRRHVLYPGWLLSLVLNCAESIDRFRSYAGAVTVEYALEVEIVSLPTGVPTLALRDDGFWDTMGDFPAGRTLFPRYSLLDADNRTALINLFWRDYWNAAGVDSGTARITAIT